MENTTFLHPKKGCHLNFKEENDIVIYMVSFLGSLAVLPGNIISALFMDKIGRIRIIGEISRKCQYRTSTITQGRWCFVWFCFSMSSSFFSRWFYAGVVSLYFPATVKFQPSSCNMLAVSLLRRQRGSLERPRSHFCGALPFF